MKCNYSETDWYCCLPEGHDGEHRSRSEGHGDVNSEYLARMVCDVLAKRYDFMNNKHIRPDFEKEIFYALEQQRKYLT